MFAGGRGGKNYSYATVPYVFRVCFYMYAGAAAGAGCRLMEAIRTGDSHWLLHLLKAASDAADQSDLDGAVHAAAWAGYAAGVRMLLAAGARLYSVNQHGQPLLVEAVASANAHCVREVLQVTIDQPNP